MNLEMNPLPLSYMLALVSRKRAPSFLEGIRKRGTWSVKLSQGQSNKTVDQNKQNCG